jgi:TolB protein
MAVSGWRSAFVLVVVGGVLAVTPGPAGAHGDHGWIERVSSSGAQGTGDSEPAAVSRNGRYVLFQSSANDLVPGDTNESQDVFLRDRWTGRTERISVSTGGAQGGSYSSAGGMTDDARYVSFSSFATNLVPGDTNGVFDGFVRDRWTGTTRRVTVSRTGAQGNMRSFVLGFSGDGRHLSFQSDASNLVPGDTNDATDGFVRNMRTGAISRVTVSNTGRQAAGGPDGPQSGAPALSHNGRYAAFMSDASNLVAGDTNDATDVFVRDRWKGTTKRVSLSSAEVPGNLASMNPGISANGRYVVFLSDASNLTPGDINHYADVFVRDRWTGTTRRIVAKLTGRNYAGATISDDGRYVSFVSAATDLVPGDTNGWEDAFVNDRRTGVTRRASVSATGEQANHFTSRAVLSRNGRYVAFSSYANNLVPGDANTGTDVFLKRWRH